ncbi:MAG: hypothetical protein AB8D78_12315 [Akkermansiaceae bacterium]
MSAVSFNVIRAESEFLIPGGIDRSEDYGPKWNEPEEFQGFVAKDMDGWIKDFDYVEVVLFNYKEDEDKRLVESGKLHKGIVRDFTKRLSDEEVTLLSKAVTGKHPSGVGGFCGFRPHHGFIFYGEDNEILGHIEICFLCSDYFYFPRQGLSWAWDLGAVGTLITRLGLPNLKNDKEWADFFSNEGSKKSNKMLR